ncbi:DUF1772 domain-containing protein [Yinghuangia sp. YIM S09857]|uniref:anthrone oxygenase family protein n=1 Tax=Yinghuangia sp. YIM S09857 TaxID=3436929 RepID=UPI003F52C236
MASLILATMTTGMMAGVFWIWANAVMPGLGQTDDRTFVAAFQAMDRAIMNPLFLAWGFLGALVTTLAAGLLHLGEDALPWIAGAFVLYLGTMVVTGAVNVPSNNALKAAGDPDAIDNAAARSAFDERRWRSANQVRVVLNTAAFGLLAYALVVTGRSGG